jgi:hypothetical protein
MTVAYDLSGLEGGEGLKQIGFYKTENANSWSAKTPSIGRNGSCFLQR